MPSSRSRKTNISEKAFSRRTSNKQIKRVYHTRSITSRGPYATDICRRCYRLDLKSIFNPTQSIPSADGRFVLALKPLQHDTACPMCSFLKSLLKFDTYRDSFQLSIFSAARLFGVSESPTNGSPVVAFTVLPRRSEMWHDENNMGDYNHGFALPRSKGRLPIELQPAIEVNAVKTNQVNYPQLNSWLEDCNSSHFVCGQTNRSKGLSVPLKCIDCHTRAVVQVRDNDDYFALSYVWGTCVPPGPHNQAFLPENISQVINDAMQVVKSLGKRYLWVDQYCIDQKDHDIKSIQIGQMDLIYAGALATIVAAAGSDANYGLPGVSRGRGEHQPSVVSDGLEIFSSMPLVSGAIKNTTWNSRGWTYQEVILSRRCLFFTEYQVYFVCRQMTCCEAISMHTLQKPLIGYNKHDPPIIDAELFQRQYRSGVTTPLTRFTNHISEYSRRSLTRTDDVLNAISGLLSIAPFCSFYGIPVASTSLSKSDIGFALGLWWAIATSTLGK